MGYNIYIKMILSFDGPSLKLLMKIKIIIKKLKVAKQISGIILLYIL